MNKHSEFAIATSPLLAATMCCLGLAMPVDAEPLSGWSLSGPGTTSISGTTLAPSFDYALQPGSSGTWTATATALESGTLYYDWDYSGFHAFFNVRVFLNAVNPSESLVNAGPENCCTEPSAGFDYSGSETLEVSEGEIIGFTFGGSHGDSDRRLLGLLEILGTFVATGAPLAEMAAASSTASRFVVLGADGVARNQGQESLVARDASLSFLRVDDTTPEVSISSMGADGLTGNLFTWAEFSGFRASGKETDNNYRGTGVQVGADIALGANMVVGLSFGTERIDTSTSFASLDGSLVFVQPYLAYRSGAWSGEATLLYGEGEYDQTGFARVGEGETQLRAMTMSAGYDLPLSDGILTPNLSLAIGQEEVTGTDGALASLGTESVDFSRVSMGTRYRQDVGQGNVFFGLYADYLETTADTLLVSDLLEDDGWSVRVELGSSMEFSSGFGLDTSVEVGGIGGNLRQFSGGLKATFKF